MKSTSFRRSGVIVRLAAAMSPLPAASPGSSWSRRTGMNTTRTFRFLFLSFFSAASFLLSSSSNSRNVINGGAAQHALIEEIEGLAVDGQHADDPPLDHPVQITGPRLLHLREIDGESPARRLLWRLLFGERGVPGKNK